MPSKKPPTPKFQKGDRVIQTNSITTVCWTANSKQAFSDRKKRGVGTVVEVVIKKNKRGANHFYYSVVWDGTKTESFHSQMRLTSAAEDITD